VFVKNTPSKPDVVELINCLTGELVNRIALSEVDKYNNPDDMFDEKL
jgi:hypothetical protein